MMRWAWSGVRRWMEPVRGFSPDAFDDTQSEPEQKSGPELVSRMARSESSVEADSRASTMRRTVATSSEPLRSGRSMTMRSTPPSSSTRTPSAAPSLTGAGPGPG